MVRQNVLYGAFMLLFALAYISYVNVTPFPMNYKVILYLPSLIMFAIFLLLAMKKGDEEEATSGYFDY